MKGLSDVSVLAKEGKINSEWIYDWESPRAFKLTKPPKGHQFERVQEKRFVVSLFAVDDVDVDTNDDGNVGLQISKLRLVIWMKRSSYIVKSKDQRDLNHSLRNLLKRLNTYKDVTSMLLDIIQYRHPHKILITCIHT